MTTGRACRTFVLLVVVLLAAGLGVAGCSRAAPSDLPAVDSLVREYDAASGTWPTIGWWNNAAALTALTDYMIESGDHRYLWVIRNTYTKKVHADRGNFIDDFTDDTGWWALAWIRAYDLTRDGRYLATAQRDVGAMWKAHDDVCGGGLWWTVDHTYKNAISNELFIKAAAELAARVKNGAGYLDHALSVWHWFAASGLINGDLLINDGLDPRTCRNNGGQTWTYNQGVILGGLVDLATATGDTDYLARARRLANASSSSTKLNPHGILVEPCEATGCSANAPSFKGIYVRNLGELNRALPDHPYSHYLLDQATSAYAADRTADNRYGLHWAGPIAAISAATQQSAVDLLVAAQPIPQATTTNTSSSSN